MTQTNYYSWCVFDKEEKKILSIEPTRKKAREYKHNYQLNRGEKTLKGKYKVKKLFVEA